MSACQVADTTDPWDRRRDVLTGLAAYPLLAISVVLAALLAAAGFRTWTVFEVSAALAGVATVWTVLFSRAHRPVAVAVYFVGRTALTAALVALNPWYAFYAGVGYIDAFRLLPRRFSVYGVGSTALIVAYAQLTGYAFTSPGAVAAWLFVAAVNGAVVGTFGYLGQRATEQNHERKQVIAKLAETNRRLEETLAENTGLHAQLVAQAREAGILDERQRLAGEIHDTLAQGLTGIVTQLEAAEQASTAPERGRHFEQARTLARESLTEARRSVRALRPEQLEAAGLPDALTSLAHRWASTRPVAVHVETTGACRQLPADVEATLFRVAQEALTNVDKHARASKIWLTLSYLDDVTLLDIRDDGGGFEVGAPVDGFGLESMRRRLQGVAGTLAVESAPGEGTIVNATVPVGQP